MSGSEENVADSLPPAASACSGGVPSSARDPGLIAAAVVRAQEARLPVAPEILLSRARRMAREPLAFFRATPALFHADLDGPFAGRAALLAQPAPRILVHGNPHLESFGTFRGPQGDPVFGLCDFDAGGVDSPERDLARLAASAVLAARAAGLGDDAGREAVSAISGEYFRAVAAAASGREHGPAWLATGEASGLVRELTLAATAVDPGAFLAPLTVVRPDGRRALALGPDLLAPAAGRADAIRAALRDIDRVIGPTPRVARPLEVLDVAEKLGGDDATYGLARYWALVAAARPGGLPAIVELREAVRSPLARAPAKEADGWAAIELEHALGAFANPLAAPVRIDGRPFLVRELEPERSRVDLARVKTTEALCDLARQAACVLGRAHGRAAANAAAIAAWISLQEREAERRLAAFAVAYADRIETVHEAWRASVVGV